MSETFGPLRHGVFRWLWLASIASNLGTWMHGVGAAWLMTSLTASVATIALLQVASALPTFLLALPAGALTDVVDRRRLLLIAQCWMAGAAAALGVLTAIGIAEPWSVLGLTFLLGIGGALNQPVWSAIVPELVPRPDLPQALVLNGLAFTGAQAIGPAFGGLLVAAAGPPAVFFLNAVSFLGQIIVIWRWQRTVSDPTLPAEHVTGAIRAGVRYLRFAPNLQIVIARTGAYVFAMSALFALLPVIARRELHLGPGGYGILFGCLGVGSVCGAFVLPRLRSRATLDVIAAGGTVILAVLLGALGAIRSLPLLYLLMGLGGLAQMSVMSTLNLAAQTALPGWVRGRGLAVYTLVFQLAIATGAITWGLLASRVGLRGALLAAAAFTITSVVLIGPLPLVRIGGADMTPVHWPEPHITITPDPEDGPVLVTCEYTIDPADADAFAVVMRALRRARRRDGAVRWGVWYDLNEPSRHVESYVVASWGEHLRQRERSTEADREAWQRVRAFHVGEAGVEVHWHLARRPPAAHEAATAVAALPLANPGQA